MAITENDLKTIPLGALQEKSRLLLSQLNHEMILTENGQFRDWRGVLNLADIDKEFKDSLRGSMGRNFMQEIMLRWIDSASSKNRDFKSLLDILKNIGRYDIYEDCLDSFIEDAEIFRNKQLQIVRSDNTVINIITSSDRQRASQGLKLLIYDAFLVYAETIEEDVAFAEKVYSFLTKEKGMRICLKDDLVPGLAFEYHALMDLINKRCRRVIVIQSSKFSSVEEEFLIKFAQDSDIRNCTKKIVPILREGTLPPQNLKMLFHLKYQERSLVNFWEKLYETIKFYPNIEVSLESDDFEYIPPTTNNLMSNGYVSLPAIPNFVNEFDPPPKTLKSEPIQQNNAAWLIEADQLKMVEDAPNPPTHELSMSIEDSVEKEKKSSYRKIVKKCSKSLSKFKKKFKNSNDEKELVKVQAN